jgi:hypothetical protein
MKKNVPITDPVWMVDPNWMQKTGGYAKDMTMRDHFAGLAIQSLIDKVVLRDQSTGMPQPVVTEVQEKIAIGAYAYADAMLKARGEV